MGMNLGTGCGAADWIWLAQDGISMVGFCKCGSDLSRQVTNSLAVNAVL
jgi:hypothetical protein